MRCVGPAASEASWLDQIEVYGFIVQRNFLTPSDFVGLAVLEWGLLAFQARYRLAARRFMRAFARRDRRILLSRLKPQPRNTSS